MPGYEDFEEESYDDQVGESYQEEAEEDDDDPKEAAFLRGYEEADHIDSDSDWEFDDELEEE